MSLPLQQAPTATLTMATAAAAAAADDDVDDEDTTANNDTQLAGHSDDHVPTVFQSQRSIALEQIARRARLDTAADLNRRPDPTIPALLQPPIGTRFTETEEFLWKQLKIIVPPKANRSPEWDGIHSLWLRYGRRLRAAGATVYERTQKQLRENQKHLQ